MIRIALQMLTGETGRYLGIIAGGRIFRVSVDAATCHLRRVHGADLLRHLYRGRGDLGHGPGGALYRRQQADE